MVGAGGVVVLVVVATATGGAPKRSSVAIVASGQPASIDRWLRRSRVDDEHAAGLERADPEPAVEVGVDQGLAGLPEIESEGLGAADCIGNDERPATLDETRRPVPVGTLDPTENRGIIAARRGDRPLVQRRGVVGRRRRRREPVVDDHAVDPVVRERFGEVDGGPFDEPPDTKRHAPDPVLRTSGVLDVDLLAVGVLDDHGAERLGALRLPAIDDHRRRAVAERAP